MQKEKAAYSVSIAEQGEDAVTTPPPEQHETNAEADRHARGVAIAIVTQNTDPEGLSRVKVTYPWIGNGAEHWARMAVPMAGKDQGTYFLPEVGQEVLVAFGCGDLRLPFVVGALWNRQERPPAVNTDGRNDQRLIRSRKGHELLFDDGAKGRVVLKFEDGKRLTMDDDGGRLEDGRGNRIEIDSASGALTVEAGGSLVLKAPSISIQAWSTLDLKAGGTLTIAGAMVTIN
jgi:uncharacterized protein involved in type VI secretion and phage assembly